MFLKFRERVLIFLDYVSKILDYVHEFLDYVSKISGKSFDFFGLRL